MQPSPSHFAIPVVSTLVKKLARLFSIFAAGFFATLIRHANARTSHALFDFGAILV
jgi:hypothetical protein